MFTQSLEDQSNWVCDYIIVVRFKRGAAKRLGKAVTKAMLDDPSFTASSQRQGLAIPSLHPNCAQYWKSIGHDVFAMVMP